MHEAHILVVEDEAIARRVLHDMLVRAGYDVTAVSSGEEAIEQLSDQRFDLLLTDLQLRKVDGMTLLATARQSDPEIEAIVLTGYATLESAISAVREGAANYILKPGQPGEIERSVAAALIRRQERRAHSTHLRRLGESLLQLAGAARKEETNSDAVQQSAAPANQVINLGQLVLDQQRHSALLDGRALNLSPGEFALLTYMAQRHQQVISPQQLAREVMGYQCDPHEARDLIKARVWALRRKIEHDPTNPELLISVRGVGYMLQVKKAR